MRIAFYVPQFPMLSETFILNQITGLLDRGHHVDIFAKRRGSDRTVHGDVEKYQLMNRTCYLDIPPNRFSRVLTGIRFILQNVRRHSSTILNTLTYPACTYRSHLFSLDLLHRTVPFLKDYDVIHCHFGPSGNLGAILKEVGIQAKLVTTFHGFDIRLGIEKGGHIYRNLFDKGDCFIAISDHNRSHLINFGLGVGKIVRLPVGIDLSRFPYKWDAEPSPNVSPVRILTVARLVKEKGLLYGIQAIHKVLQQRPELNIEYIIIGGGPLEHDLKNLVRKLMLDDVVHFLGPQEQSDVIDLLLQGHIFLLPSIAEVLPVCLMEAQAVGLPAVATKVGDVARIVLDKESGFVVGPGDVDALADKLSTLIQHPMCWPEMGLAGRRHVEHHYDINKLNDKLVEVYTKLSK